MAHANQPAPAPLNILFTASEAQPLIKTGGLADVAGSLPGALRALGQDARVMLPAYPEARERAGELNTLSRLHLPGSDRAVELLGGQLQSGVPVYLVDAPWYFDRPGNPYVGPDGRDWNDAVPGLDYRQNGGEAVDAGLERITLQPLGDPATAPLFRVVGNLRVERE